MNSLEAGFDAAFEVRACPDQVNLFILVNQIYEGDLQLIFGIAELLFDFPNGETADEGLPIKRSGSHSLASDVIVKIFGQTFLSHVA